MRFSASARGVKRAPWDATTSEVLAGIYEPDEHGRQAPESPYGSPAGVFAGGAIRRPVTVCAGIKWTGWPNQAHRRCATPL